MKYRVLDYYEITLCGHFPAASWLPSAQPLLLLLLQISSKSVIPYRIGRESSNHAACSQYTRCSETYRRYVSNPPVNPSTRVDRRSTVRNTEV